MKPTEINMNPLEDNNTEIERKKVEIVESIDKKLPKAVIIGVKKCGTGALIEMLKMHPQVAAPSYYETEVKFWGFDDLYKQGLEYYKDKMPIANSDQIVIVKAPGVINETPNQETTLVYLNRLYQAIPDVKVILVVKNPIDRLVSHIVHEYIQWGGKHQKEKMPDVNDIIMGRAGEIKGISDLAFHLSNYTLIYKLVSEVFDKKNIMVVDGDNLIKNPINEIGRVETFLTVARFFEHKHFIYPKDKKGFPCFLLGEHVKCMEKDKGRKHPSLNQESVDFLLERYVPVMESFGKETGIHLQYHNAIRRN